MRHIGSWLAAAAILATAPPALADAPPAMSHDEVMQMFGAGGFSPDPDGAGMVNRCGEPARPRVRFIDLDNDHRPEALFLDTGACYGADGEWFAIATRPDGSTWRQVAGTSGVIKGLQTTTNGWQDILWTSGGVQETLHYDGQRYVDQDGVAPDPPLLPYPGGQ